MGGVGEVGWGGWVCAGWGLGWGSGWGGVGWVSLGAWVSRPERECLLLRVYVLVWFQLNMGSALVWWQGTSRPKADGSCFASGLPR